MAVFSIPLGDQGLYGGRNLARLPPEYLLKAENIAFDDGSIRKEGGAAIYNSALPASFTERSNPKNIALNGAVWNGSIIVAIGAADGTDSYILTSPDGVTWTERAPTVSKNIALNDVCWSVSLALFVAVGAADGTDGYILTSPDGITWTEMANPKNFGLNDVLWAPSLALFVAVGAADGTDAYLITSSDGVTWSERANPKNFGLNGISWDGTTLVAVGAADGTDSYIVTSTNATTWTERAPTVSKNIALNSVLWSASLSLFVAVGAADGTDSYILTSPTGTTWTERAPTVAKNFGLNALVSDGVTLTAVGEADGTDAYIVTYGTIFSFTERTNPKDFALNDIVFTGRIYVAVGNADGTDAYVLTSTDLSTWTERSNDTNSALRDIIWTGYRYVAVGAAKAFGSDAYIVNSDNGISWTSVSNPKNFQLNGLAWNGQVLVAVGAADGTDAYILTSQDGEHWTEQSNPKNLGLNAVVWTGSLFVAVGSTDGLQDAYIVTSPDGITWTERANPDISTLAGVAWDGSMLVAVGTGTVGYIITSADGITWTKRVSPTASPIYDVIWNGKLFMAVGNGEIIFSFNGIEWQNHVITTAATPLRGIVWDGANFVFVGDNTGTDAYLLTLNYSQNNILGGSYWNHDGATPKIVALDGAGRLLMDGFDGGFSTVLKSGLTVTSSTFPVFVKGGKEVAANNRKLFAFTGANAVQVLSGSGTTTANIATPPADWAGANQPTGGLIHKNRLWGYGNANDPHRLYYSLTTNHEDFTTSGAGSLSIYPGEGQKIVNAISYKGYIIVWKYPAGIYIVDTTSVQTSGWQVDRVNERLGGAGQGSAAVVEEDIVFIDHTGELRVVAGITEFGDIGSRSLSDMHDISVFIRDNYYLPSNTQWRMEYYSKKRELHIGASSNYLGINDNRMVVDFNRDVPRFRNSTRDTCLYLFSRELNGVPELMSCDNLGNIWRLDQDTKSKDGQGYTSQFQTMYTDLGLPYIDKAGQFIQIDYEPTDTTIAIDVLWDGVYQETTTMVLDAVAEVQPGRLVLTKQVPLNGDGVRVSLVVRNSNAAEDFAIQGMRIIHDNAGLPEEAS